MTRDDLNRLEQYKQEQFGQQPNVSYRTALRRLLADHGVGDADE